jgi:hypothetical protein
VPPIELDSEVAAGDTCGASRAVSDEIARGTTRRGSFMP